MDEFDPDTDLSGTHKASLEHGIDMIKRASQQSMESAKANEASLKYGCGLDESMPTDQAISTL